MALDTTRLHMNAYETRKDFRCTGGAEDAEVADHADVDLLSDRAQGQ